MNIQHLAYFINLVEDGKPSETASKLYVSRSTLTKAIKSLESEVGKPLLAREGSPFKPTQSGEMFYKYAKHALLSIEEGISMAQDPSKTLSRILRIGMGHVIRKQYVSHLIDHCLSTIGMNGFPVEWHLSEREELTESLRRTNRYRHHGCRHRKRQHLLHKHGLLRPGDNRQQKTSYQEETAFVSAI